MRWWDGGSVRGGVGLGLGWGVVVVGLWVWVKLKSNGYQERNRILRRKQGHTSTSFFFKMLIISEAMRNL